MADAIGIKITNLAQIKRAFNKAPQLMKIGLSRAIPLSLRAIKDDEEMQYAHLGIGVVTGRLLMSVRTGMYYRSGTLYGEVGPNVQNSPGVKYSVFVHEGTRFMRKRPFLLNAVKSAQPEVNRQFKEAVDKVLNEIGKST